MKRGLTKLLPVFLVLAWSPCSLVAQPRERRTERIEKKIDQQLMLRLSEEMDLEDDILLKIVGAQKAKREKSKALKEQMQRETKDLGKLVADSASSEKDIKRSLAKLEQFKEKLMELEKQTVEEIGKILSPRQFAQYILLTTRFRKEVWRMMGEHRGKGRQHRPDPKGE